MGLENPESRYYATLQYDVWEITISGIDNKLLYANKYLLDVHAEGELESPHCFSSIARHFKEIGVASNLSAADVEEIISWYVYGSPLGGKRRKRKRMIKRAEKMSGVKFYVY